MYNNKAIRRVVRAGRRSTIGNRVTGYNLFEGSNPLLSAKNEKAVPQGMAFSFFICKGFEQGGSRLCLRKKTILWTVFADAVKEHRDAKAYGSMPKKSLAELTIVFYNTKTGRQFGCLPVLLFVSNIGGVENHLGFEKVAVD